MNEPETSVRADPVFFFTFPCSSYTRMDWSGLLFSLCSSFHHTTICSHKNKIIIIYQLYSVLRWVSFLALGNTDDAPEFDAEELAAFYADDRQIGL